MNFPNLLTLSRMLLTVVFIAFLLQEGVAARLAATMIFILASFTDILDGYIAKKRNLITDFGKIMDPIADKFLMLSAFYIFMILRLIAAWMFWVICFREVLVTLVRLYAIKKGEVLAAENLGKIKTVSQTTVISVILIYMILKDAAQTTGWSHQTWQYWQMGVAILMWVAVLLTVISGLDFLKNHRKLSRVR
ncbi:MAG TPA: CDP-diacylglycerol--glycerol-3-phosphate 3-phosphatidyltransferase [Candidatus Omnitrophota bacterium]|nr:CDP-diacylglycerol--glycerol-3-phosphate 3-phosphatidyltransferase [Candidatus Omnitrophota bacterium]